MYVIGVALKLMLTILLAVSPHRSFRRVSVSISAVSIGIFMEVAL